MDITIPPHSLKKFTAAVTCLGKVGRDLYWSFDPMDGLTLSSLNEAKSAFCKFHFEPGFFQRCSAPQGAGNATAGTASTAGSDEEDGCRYVCRVPVRSVHSILRRRSGVCQLRVRSEGQDDEGNHFGLSNRKRRNRDDEHPGDDYSDGEENNGRSSSRRRRKRRKQERKKKARAQDEHDTAYPNSISSNTDKMMLSFEFFIERPQKATEGDAATSNPSAGGSGGGGGVFKVLHKVGVTDANGITLSASIHQSSRSEIFCKPKLWLRLLDPLRKTAEVALTIDDGLRVVTATSFHPGEIRQMAAAAGGGGETGANAVLQAAAARNALLKTETSTSVEEFVEYDFRSNRGKKRKKRRGNGDGEVEDEEGAADESDRPPPT
ncbi:hypothetical protein THAOC_05711, partial [Thalassiosira oceanica]